MGRMTLPTWLLMVLCVSGCSGLPVPWRATYACAQIENLQQLDGVRLVFFGELHGTSEAPSFVGDVLCNVAIRNESVTLALELPDDLQDALTQFVDDGQKNSPARSALLAHPFWSAGDADGRSSLAMLQLIERARALRMRGFPIRVVAFDQSSNKSVPGASREQRMAEHLRSQFEGLAPDGKLIVLTGNLHSRSERGLPWNASFESAAYLLRELNPLSLDIAHSGGTAWNCAIDGCAARTMRPSVPEDLAAINTGIYRSETWRGHDGLYFVGAISASLPLVARRGSSH